MKYVEDFAVERKMTFFFCNICSLRRFFNLSERIRTFILSDDTLVEGRRNRCGENEFRPIVAQIVVVVVVANDTRTTREAMPREPRRLVVPRNRCGAVPPYSATGLRLLVPVRTRIRFRLQTCFAVSFFMFPPLPPVRSIDLPEARGRVHAQHNGGYSRRRLPVCTVCDSRMSTVFSLFPATFPRPPRE